MTIRRNFDNLNMYLNKLVDDVYEQPPDDGHTAWATEVFKKWFGGGRSTVKKVLDVGCGDTAFMKAMFESECINYTGIALRTDHPDVINMDFTFLDFPDNSFDMIFSRHSLEHSPMPIISLMEWHRVSSNWLCLILPNPLAFGWTGRNHYSVLHPSQAEFLLDRAGWHIIWTDFTNTNELRYMCEKIRTSEYERSTGDTQ